MHWISDTKSIICAIKQRSEGDTENVGGKHSVVVRAGGTVGGQCGEQDTGLRPFMLKPNPIPWTAGRWLRSEWTHWVHCILTQGKGKMFPLPPGSVADSMEC